MYAHLHKNQEKSTVTREIAEIGSFDDRGSSTMQLLWARMQGLYVLLIYRVRGTEEDPERESKLAATFRSVCRPTTILQVLIHRRERTASDFPLQQPNIVALSHTTVVQNADGVKEPRP